VSASILLKSTISGGEQSCNTTLLRGKAHRPLLGAKNKMDKAEIAKLREFLRRSFGAPTLSVAPNSKSAEAADVSLGERKLGTITVDDEDGDRSFAFAMKLPVGRPVLQDYVRRLFENDELRVAGLSKKGDSVELNNGPEFLGVISADDPEGSSFTLQVAILDVDLDEE
jgi:hypothetical protein